MSKLYYSFGLYCMNNIVLIASMIFIVHCLFGLLFQVQTYTNAKREVEVSPTGTRYFFRILATIVFVGLLILLIKLYVPITLCTPKILSGTSLGVRGEVLSNYRGQIAVFWVLCILILLFFTGKKLLFTLTKRIKRLKGRTEIFIWGKTYSICLLLQSILLAQGVLILVGTLCGQYSDVIQVLWIFYVYAELILIIINGILEHQKIIIFNNGLVVYSKFRKEGFARREDIEIGIENQEVVKIRIKGLDIFNARCSTANIKELVEFNSHC